jgi:hypothetical protein
MLPTSIWVAETPGSPPPALFLITTFEHPATPSVSAATAPASFPKRLRAIGSPQARQAALRWEERAAFRDAVRVTCTHRGAPRSS